MSLRLRLSQRLRPYRNREALAYFALSLPALLLQLVLILNILKTPINLPGPAGYEALIAQYSPWVVLAFSVYAVVTFRSSLLLTLLILSYFITSVITGATPVSAGRYLLGSGEIAVLVVGVSFCSLIGFGFSRAARIQRNRAVVDSGGPVPHQAVGLLFELLLPVVIAIGLVMATILVAGALRNEALLFPAPLSTIFSGFFVSPFITIVIAALTLVLVKDLVEPWIMYYTITREDAVKILEKEAARMQARKGLLATLASGGLLFSSLAIGVLLFAILFAFGPRTLLANVAPVFGIGKPTQEPGFLILANNAYIEFQNLLERVIHLLWG